MPSYGGDTLSTMQNYKATSPCPICGRYKTAYKDKCFGFITTDGRYAYCSREESADKTIERFSHRCWRHSISGLGATPLINADISRNPSASALYQQPSDLDSQREEGLTKPLQIEQEEWIATQMEELEKVLLQRKQAIPLEQPQELSKPEQSPEERNGIQKQTPE